jgi:hypothetical protein
MQKTNNYALAQLEIVLNQNYTVNQDCQLDLGKPDYENLHSKHVIMGLVVGSLLAATALLCCIACYRDIAESCQDCVKICCKCLRIRKESELELPPQRSSQSSLGTIQDREKRDTISVLEKA